MSDACTINVLCEYNWQLIDDSSGVIDGYRGMLQIKASFMIIIYNCHIFIVQATGVTVI
jgi:hypothetical protein